ncbi:MULTISPECIES: hypothetical protein [Nocardia]|uniref:Uncharacterized protein n=1 Tax=Nocardia nova TaxID=37330 RepID=A0A2T2YWS2_9NOCA|nr:MULTISPECIES: hypothetical protein [Nocardia]PSR59951.1 hypothetical protein C8259_25365 [Nocardia nova]
MSTTTTTTTTHRDPVDEILTAIMHLLGWGIVAVFTAAWWALLFPMVSLPIAATAGLFWLYGWAPALGLGIASTAALGLWRVRYPESFSRWITHRARSRFLAWFRYRRQWGKRLNDCNLTRREQQAVKVPRLLDIQIGDSTDRVQVRMLSGQCPEDWTNRTAHLAHAFGAQECRASIVGPARVELVFRHADSLAEPIPVHFPHIPGGLGGPPRQEDNKAA